MYSFSFQPYSSIPYIPIWVPDFNTGFQNLAWKNEYILIEQVAQAFATAHGQGQYDPRNPPPGWRNILNDEFKDAANSWIASINPQNWSFTIQYSFLRSGFTVTITAPVTYIPAVKGIIGSKIITPEQYIKTIKTVTGSGFTSKTYISTIQPSLSEIAEFKNLVNLSNGNYSEDGNGNTIFTINHGRFGVTPFSYFQALHPEPDDSSLFDKIVTAGVPIGLAIMVGAAATGAITGTAATSEAASTGTLDVGVASGSDLPTYLTASPLTAAPSIPEYIAASTPAAALPVDVALGTDASILGLTGGTAAAAETGVYGTVENIISSAKDIYAQAKPAISTIAKLDAAYKAATVKPKPVVKPAQPSGAPVSQAGGLIPIGIILGLLLLAA